MTEFFHMPILKWIFGLPWQCWENLICFILGVSVQLKVLEQVPCTSCVTVFTSPNLQESWYSPSTLCKNCFPLRGQRKGLKRNNPMFPSLWNQIVVMKSLWILYIPSIFRLPHLAATTIHNGNKFLMSKDKVTIS